MGSTDDVTFDIPLKTTGSEFLLRFGRVTRTRECARESSLLRRKVIHEARYTRVEFPRGGRFSRAFARSFRLTMHP